jgi:ABC-type lipoprotein release transport system permease subunit
LAMLGVVGLAAWIPANRALKVSPADALRVE